MHAQPSARLTERQQTIITVLGSMRWATTYDLAQRINRNGFRDHAALILTLRRMVNLGLVLERGVKFGPKRWSLTETGEIAAYTPVRTVCEQCGDEQADSTDGGRCGECGGRVATVR